MITALLGGFVFGIFTGLCVGRYFCKWHHAKDNANKHLEVLVGPYEFKKCCNGNCGEQKCGS